MGLLGLTEDLSRRPIEKYSAFQNRQISVTRRLSHPAKGRLAIVTNRAVGCGGRCRRQMRRAPDEAQAADGEMVWSWRRDPGATFAALLQTTGARKAAPRGEHL
jgi:hypothetical protein